MPARQPIFRWPLHAVTPSAVTPSGVTPSGVTPSAVSPAATGTEARRGSDARDGVLQRADAVDRDGDDITLRQGE